MISLPSRPHYGSMIKEVVKKAAAAADIAVSIADKHSAMLCQNVWKSGYRGTNTKNMGGLALKLYNPLYEPVKTPMALL